MACLEIDKKVLAFYRLHKAPSLPVSMQEQETESSRMLAALEKKHVQTRQQRADAISFGKYRKDGGRHV